MKALQVEPTVSLLNKAQDLMMVVSAWEVTPPCAQVSKPWPCVRARGLDMQGETCQGDQEPLGEVEPAHPNQQGMFGRAHDDRCPLQEP